MGRGDKQAEAMNGQRRQKGRGDEKAVVTKRQWQQKGSGEWAEATNRQR
jgi:hypothetical protein